MSPLALTVFVSIDTDSPEDLGTGAAARGDAAVLFAGLDATAMGDALACAVY